MKSIKQMSLESAKPGTRLGYDVLDDKGNRLLAAGSKLTEQALTMLGRRNITHIHIAEDEIKSPEQLDIMRGNIEKSLMHRFRKATASSEMRRFKSILLDFQLAKLE